MIVGEAKGGVPEAGCLPDTQPVYAFTPASSGCCKNHSALALNSHGWMDVKKQREGEKQKRSNPEEPDITQCAISGKYYDFYQG